MRDRLERVGMTTSVVEAAGTYGRPSLVSGSPGQADRRRWCSTATPTPSGWTSWTPLPARIDGDRLSDRGAPDTEASSPRWSRPPSRLRKGPRQVVGARRRRGGRQPRGRGVAAGARGAAERVRWRRYRPSGYRASRSRSATKPRENRASEISSRTYDAPAGVQPLAVVVPGLVGNHRCPRRSWSGCAAQRGSGRVDGGRDIAGEARRDRQQ